MPIKQVMSFKSYVAHLRNIPAGFSVSYGCRWTSAQPTTLAVVPVGYADGVVRRLTGCGLVAIKGKRYPIVGTVTMDHIMIDIGSASIDIGDEVVLWGQAGSSEIQALEVADQIGTIPYELTCGVSRRVRRFYISQKGDEAD
jgi:alanine racemase